MSDQVQDTAQREKQGRPFKPRDWRNLARIRQRIVDRQDRTIKQLTASVVQLENDYDLVETELKQLHSQPNFTAPLKTSRPW